MPEHAGRPPHVLFFTSELGGGGAEKHLVRLANALGPDRFRVSVAVARGGGAYEPELASGVALHALAPPGGRGGLAGMARAVLPLRRLVRRERPDLLCSFMDHANCAALLAVSGMRGRPATVAGVQVSLAKQLLERPGRGARALVRGIRLLYPRADRVVALSEGVRGELTAFLPALGGRVDVVPNAGTQDDLARLAGEGGGGPRGAGPVLVAAGRLTEQKGFVHLLRALARVRERVPATLWLLGEGEERAALEAEAARLGVADAVWFGGFQANPYRFMAAGDVFVLSSLWEGFGNVIVEAMACGAPVVSTACPHGPEEIIRPGENGLLVPPADPEALASAVLRVLEDPALAARLRDGGRRRAGDFSPERVAAGYAAVFERVLAERPRARRAPRSALPAAAARGGG